MSKIRQVGNNFIKSDKFIYSLLRAGVTSQTSSWVDLFTSFALFAWVGLMPGVATAIGAVIGGVINCVMNFHFTFHAQECSWRAVVVKYTMVWVGSILLNSFGTEGLFKLFVNWPWLETIGFNPDGSFAAARLITALVVSLFWNLLLQARFVYRITSFDPYAIRIMDLLTFHKIKKHNN